MLQFIHQSATNFLFKALIWLFQSSAFRDCPAAYKMALKIFYSMASTSPSGLLCSLPPWACHTFSSFALFHQILSEMCLLLHLKAFIHLSEPHLYIFSSMKAFQTSPDKLHLTSHSKLHIYLSHWIDINGEQESWVKRSGSNWKISFITCCAI